MDSLITTSKEWFMIDKVVFLDIGKRYQMRYLEISLYLHEHPEITHYVAVDDMDSKGLGEHIVQTSDRLTRKLADKCIAILSTD